MYLNNFISRLFLIPIVILTLMNSATAQENKPAQKTTDLFKEIEYMDSVIFEAFNMRNMEKFKALFTEDLEWFQDNDGVKSYKKVFEDFENFRIRLGT